MLCFTRLVKATVYSLKGLQVIWQREMAFRQECLLLLVAIFVTMILDIPLTHCILLISSVALILIVEVINSAIETAVDRISKAHHPLSAQAKDMGSAAVLLTILLAFFIWIIVLCKA